MLEAQRQQIDQIDRELVRLFEARTAVVEEVAAIKQANGMEILDSGREQQVIDKVQSYLQDPELADELADLYTELMRISRGHQARWMEQQTH